MAKLIVITFLLVFSRVLISQDFKVSNRQLSSLEIESILTGSIKKKFHINFSVYRAYEYNDKLGQHLIVMTENEVSCNQRDNCIDSIKAFCFDVENNKLKLKWKLTDFLLPEGNEVSEEYSITFWTKYFKLDDYDNDGVVDPIIVYGTIGMNGYSDGRIKILVYNKGMKYAIRHQNGTLDYQRNSQVDKAFYNLPKGIRNRVNEIMNNITENNHGIFPHGWEEAMKNEELKFDEN